MKEMLLQYGSYSAWANERILSLILTLSPEQQQREVASSFNSLYKTVWHVWNAEHTWWKRFPGVAVMNGPGEPGSLSMEALADGLMTQDRAWLGWVEAFPEPSLQEELHYKNLKGDSYHEPYYQLLMHLFNHATYHRGQLVTMLRQIGIETIPQTDFIVWVRMRR